jgi:hypothetical protein
MTKMKTLTFLVFLVIFSLQAVAQLDQSKLLYAQRAEKYSRMKNTGATLTVAGSILLVVGVITLSNSSITTTSTSGGPYQTTTTGNPGLGALAFLGGAVGLGVGIPFWIVGAKKQKRNERLFEQVSVRFNLTPQKQALSLTFRF